LEGNIIKQALRPIEAKPPLSSVQHLAFVKEGCHGCFVHGVHGNNRRRDDISLLACICDAIEHVLGHSLRHAQGSSGWGVKPKHQ